MQRPLCRLNDSVRSSLLAAGVLAGGILGAGQAQAQSMVAAMVPDVISATQGGCDLIVIDPQTGSWQFYMRVNFDTSGGRVLRGLTALPNNRLAGMIYRDDGTANNVARPMSIDPFAGTFAVSTFGAPLATAYSEGFEYSPRHNAILVSFGPVGNFSTTRLATVDPATWNVLVSTNALAGITDIDSLASTSTDDYLFDLNGTVASGRVRRMTALMPAPTFASFASPPVLTLVYDFAAHPATGQITFTDSGGRRLVRLSGNTYINGATLAEDAAIRGLAWATLPPRNASVPGFAGACLGGTATLTASAVGTPPFTFAWRKNGILLDPVANPSAATATLVLPDIGPDDVASYTCEITNSLHGIVSPPVPLTICTADFNCDGSVDNSDFNFFVTQYVVFLCGEEGMSAGCPADLNSDGQVDEQDFAVFVTQFNRLLCGE